jgi:FMN phosphatase YigB (HAD superfamily)
MAAPGPRIRLVVTDLDNTLYDWVTCFTTAFYRMVAVAAERLVVDEERLIDELREIHRRYGNSEQPFALMETRAVLERYPGVDRPRLARELDDAFQAFNRERGRHLRLYDGVLDTLQRLRRAEVPVVVHTEATVPNALHRLRALGLERLFECLYAIEPAGQGHYDPERARSLLDTPMRVVDLSAAERKPDPRVLLEICRQMRVPAADTLYVGDSIRRDVGMAKRAGAWAAWAEYGTRFDPALWEQLVRVTHWSEQDVSAALLAESPPGEAVPDLVLKESLLELFDHFTFWGRG